MKVSRNTIISILLFAVLLTVYIITLFPTIYIGKSADFVNSALGISILKPTNHPAWYLLSRLFVLFSPANPAYALNLMSAFFGAWTIALLYVILANISHDRTIEEMSRFNRIPLLRQIAAIAGVLLLAFSPAYWGASTLAGPDTLKAFLFVLSALYLIKYLYLRKKRYLLFLSIAVGVALANSPTIFLFIPIIIAVLLFRCREIADDPIIVFVCFILFLVAFMAFTIPIPRSYISDPKPAYMTPTSLIQAFSYTLEWHYYDLKSIFPASQSIVLVGMWLFLLIIPTFLPILYLSWRKSSQAIGTIPPSWTIIKHLMMLIFTILGITYLFGFDFYTLTHINIMKHEPPLFIVPLVLIASWLSYSIGYWIIILSGMKEEHSAHEDDERSLYKKPVFVFLSILILLLPIALLGLNISQGARNKNGTDGTLPMDYCEDILRSCEPGSVIVVPEIISIKGGFQGYGSVLTYANYCLNKSEEAVTDDAKHVIIDMPTAAILNLTNRIDLERYLISLIWNETDSSEVSRVKFSDIKTSPYDRIIQEASKYQEIAKKDSKVSVYFLHNNMLFGPQNQLINSLVNFVPKGNVYKAVFYDDPEYSVTDAIENNRALWKDFAAKQIKAKDIKNFYSPESGLEKRFSVEGFILNNYSRLVNDAGVLLNEQGISLNNPEFMKEASEYFEYAIEFNPDNASSMENLAQYLEKNTGSEARVEKLRRRVDEVKNEESKKIKDIISAEESIKDRETLRSTEKVLTNLRIVLLFGYIREPEFYRKYVELGYSGIMAKMPQEERQPYYALQFKMLNLALSMDPVSPELHIDKALFLQGSNALMHKLQAIIEYKTALDNGAINKRRILQEIAASYARLNNPIPAENYYKRAIKESSIETDPARIRVNDIEAKFLLLNLYATARFNLEEGLNMAKEINQSAEKEEREIFFRSVEYIFTFMILTDKIGDIPAYVKEFASKNLEWETEIKQSLAVLYVKQNKIKEAGKVYEEIVDKADDKDGTMALALANLYSSQKEWEKLIALNMKSKDPIKLVESGFHLLKGQAYLITGQKDSSLKEYELALKNYEESDPKTRSAMTFDKNRILNDLAWIYYLSGWEIRDTEEGKNLLDSALKNSREVYENTRRTQISIPANLLMWETYAWILYRYKGDKNESFAIMQRVYTGNPEHPQVAYHYGVMLCDMGRTEEGLDLIAKGYASNLIELEDKEAAEILKANNRELPEKRKPD